MGTEMARLCSEGGDRVERAGRSFMTLRDTPIKSVNEIEGTPNILRKKRPVVPLGWVAAFSSSSSIEGGIWRVLPFTGTLDWKRSNKMRVRKSS